MGAEVIIHIPETVEHVKLTFDGTDPDIEQGELQGAVKLRLEKMTVTYSLREGAWRPYKLFYEGLRVLKNGTTTGRYQPEVWWDAVQVPAWLKEIVEANTPTELLGAPVEDVRWLRGLLTQNNSVEARAWLQRLPGVGADGWEPSE